jgi:hypothetical protein
MWTCNKCGESIEDQFDSCWHCVRRDETLSRPTSRVTLKPAAYLWAGLVAYAVPFAGLFVSGFDFHAGALHRSEVWAWMAIPGAVSFLILWPFLKRAVLRCVVLACLWLGWTYVFGLAAARVK